MGKAIRLADIRKALDEVEKNKGNACPISDKSIDVILEVLLVAELELVKSEQK